MQDVDTSDGHFVDTPVYFASLGGYEGHEMVMGAPPRTAVQPLYPKADESAAASRTVRRRSGLPATVCLRAQSHRLSSLSVRVSLRACVRACFECACIGSAAGRGVAQIGQRWSLCFGIRTDRFFALNCHT